MWVWNNVRLLAGEHAPLLRSGTACKPRVALSIFGTLRFMLRNMLSTLPKAGKAVRAYLPVDEGGSILGWPHPRGVNAVSCAFSALDLLSSKHTNIALRANRSPKQSPHSSDSLLAHWFREHRCSPLGRGKCKGITSRLICALACPSDDALPRILLSSAA